MGSDQLPDQPVIRCYNKPGIPASTQARLTAEGLFVADYGSEWSLSSAQVSDKDRRPAAGNAFNRIIDLSHVGGFGTIRTPNDDDEIITIGEWEPNCATFREVDGVKLKGAQMARYGIITPEDSRYSDIDEIYSGSGATVDMAKQSEQLLKKTIEELEHQGRLRAPWTQ